MSHFETLISAQSAWIGGDKSAAEALLDERLGAADVLELQGEAQVRGEVILPDLKWNLLAALMIQWGRLDHASRLVESQFGVSDFKISIENGAPGQRGVLEINSDGSKISLNSEYLSPSYWLICLRLVEILPVIIFCIQNVSGNGRCIFSFSDLGDENELSFCSNKSNSILIADNYFLSSDAYRSVRETYSDNFTLWDDRSNKVFWRGSTTGHRSPDWRSLPRIKLCQIANSDENDRFDCFISHVVQENHTGEAEEIEAAGLLDTFILNDNLVQYKFHIDIDGNSNSWPGLFTKLLSGGVVLKVASENGYRQWYYSRLKPWVHYVPVDSDLQDLVEKVEWLHGHDDQARLIGEAGRALAMEMTLDSEAKCALHAFEAGFSRGVFGENSITGIRARAPLGSADVIDGHDQVVVAGIDG